VFGLVTPCRHSLPGRLHDLWTAHLCGLCLALRDRHGPLARTATNVDAALVSVLVAAQQPQAVAERVAGPCALRGLRPARVVRSGSAPARLAAGVSLTLAGGLLADHCTDGDLPRPARLPAARTARRWERRGRAELAGAGLDAAPLTGIAVRQARVEAGAGGLAASGGARVALLDVTAATEDAVGAAFAHTAVLAGRPSNAAALADAGRMLGRVAHLTDALTDRADDDRRGRWNPLTATAAPAAVALDLVDGALARARDAAARLDLPGARPGAPAGAAEHAELARRLLVDVLPRSVHQALARAGHSVRSCATGSGNGHGAGHGAGPGEPLVAGDETRRRRWCSRYDCCDCCSCCDADCCDADCCDCDCDCDCGGGS